MSPMLTPNTIARSVALSTTTIVGGVPQYKQVSALQRGEPPPNSPPDAVVEHFDLR